MATRSPWPGTVSASELYEVSAQMREQSDFDALRCYVKAQDLGGHTEQEVAYRLRRCELFMKYRPGLTLSAHQTLQERGLTMRLALVSALVGGGLALAGTALALLLG